MKYFDLLCRTAGALGSIAAVVGVIITLASYRKKLKVTGEFPIRNSNVFVIRIANSRNCDNEVKSIDFIKGNPRKSESHIFHSVSFSGYTEHLNPTTNNIIVPHSSYVDIPVPCKCVACNYKKIGEAFGKPFDTIFVQVRDVNGNTYSINTNANVNFFRKLSE